MPQNFHPSLRKSLTSGALIVWGHSRLHAGTVHTVLLTTCQNGLKQKLRSPPMMPEVVCKFWEITLFSRFGDTTEAIITDNQEKDEKQRQNDKTGLGMEKTVKDKAKSKPKSQSSQKVNRKVNWSKSKSTHVNQGPKSKK
ncbi:hypothetical protein Tco_1575587 [Tanacetum coccineum]